MDTAAGTPRRHPELGIRALRADLADTIRRARAGQRTVITSHGHAVAQVAPLDESSPGVDQLVSSGALIPPRRTGAWRPPAPVRILHGTRIDQALRDLRG